jgi:hypothetical protein
LPAIAEINHGRLVFALRRRFSWGGRGPAIPGGWLARDPATTCPTRSAVSGVGGRQKNAAAFCGRAGGLKPWGLVPVGDW